MKVQRPEEARFLKALIYGPPGQGKTTFLGSAQLDERTKPLLVLDFEGGVQSLVGLDVDTVQVRNWKTYSEVYNELVAGKTKYKSIGVDSISETHVFSLLDILKTEGPTRKDPDALQQGDYGKASVQMRRLLRSFRDLPLHVFFTALMKEDLDPREGMIKKPALAGQMSEEVSGIMDVVAYLAISTDPETQEPIRSLLLKNFPRYRVKVRTGWNAVCPDYIDNPTVGLLMDALRLIEAKEAA